MWGSAASAFSCSLPVAFRTSLLSPVNATASIAGNRQRRAHTGSDGARPRDYVGALGYGVREDSIQSNRRKQQRQQSEGTEERRALCGRRQLTIHDRFQSLETPDGLVLVNRPDRLTDGRDNRRRVDRGAHDDAVRQAADLVGLVVQAIHGGRP